MDLSTPVRERVMSVLTPRKLGEVNWLLQRAQTAGGMAALGRGMPRGGEQAPPSRTGSWHCAIQ